MLQRHDDALNRHDLDGVLALYTSKSVVLGTGPGERYQGQDEIRVAYTEFFKDFDKGTLSSNCYWKDGDVIGNAAWAAASCKLSDSLNKKPREFELNVSTALQKTSGKWQFSVLHFSQLIGGTQKQTDLQNGRR
jgi:ketosteroid isomerase-like protein